MEKLAHQLVYPPVMEQKMVRECIDKENRKCNIVVTLVSNLPTEPQGTGVGKKVAADKQAVYNMTCSTSCTWKLKTRSGIEDLKRENGPMARTSQEKAEGLSRYFSTTFTQENLQLIPDLPVRSQGNLVEDVVFSSEYILKRMKTLNPVKSPGDQDAVERVLRHATILDQALRKLPYEERLNRLDLPSMFYRRQRVDVIMLFQIVTGKIGILQDKLFARAEDQGTRRHRFKLRKPQVNRLTRQQCFSVRVISHWNSLSLKPFP
ncbi:hypothetical protein Pcinc_031796 [Petrolisthes cinctipes]|uniref:Uncharacterized protein n=1 Tax=Petrolisthes cinctipes TaxID=88211 RepID=A0AAE1K233_PETCI|nr:hypothetical protein Pcinc_031796 [Petrolisthes cinctipes]